MIKAPKLLLFAVLTAFLSGTSAQAAKVDVLPAENIGYDVERFALVVGNSDYEFIADLDNTLNDSRAIARSLQSVGFKVFHAQNVTRRDLNDAIDEYLAAITPGSEALIYYAGHGVELGGENYLLPTDIRQLRPSQQRRLREESVGLTRLLEDLKARQARVNLVLLDACRDNPFPKENTRSLGSNAGLGRIDPPNGTVVVYAAAAGEKALDKLSEDDPNPNGLFTRHLLNLIDKPGLEIRPLVQELKERVYNEARTASLRTQRPSYYDGLIGKFYFRPQAEALTLKHPCEVLINPRAPTNEVLSNDYNAMVPMCQRAIVLYPNKPIYRTLLQSAQEQWVAQKALKSNDTALARDYIQRYGNGLYTRDVTLHLAKLDPSVAVPAANTQVASRAASNSLTPSVQAPQVKQPQAELPQIQQPQIQQPQVQQPQVQQPQVQQPIQQAALTPGPILSAKEIRFEIQTELNRLGCSAGKPDGLWGKRSARAVRNYIKNGGAQFASLDPTADMLNVLRGEQGAICPLTCGRGETIQNGQCVARTCAAGQRLSSKGNCYTPKTKSKSVNACARGQKRNSRGVCYTPKKRTAKTTTRRKTTRAAPARQQQKWKTPKKTNRRARGVSGYNYQCDGAGPGLC